MPNDIAHWRIARRTAELLAGSPYEAALRAEPEALLLAALFHDVLAYSRGGDAPPFIRLGQRWHGRGGEDTYALPRAQAKLARSAPDASAPLAALVGLATHVHADATFHPLVYHAIGLSHIHHRALETLLDMVFCGGPAGVGQYSMAGIVAALAARGLRPRDVFPLAALGEAEGMAPGELEQGFDRALRLFSRMQRACCTRWLASLLHALSPFMPERFRAVAALFYSPRLYRQADRLRGELDYRHPVTGEALRASVDELAERSAQRAAAFCREIEPWVFGGAAGPFPGVGPSLSTGLPGVGRGAMRHFAERPLVEFP